MTTNLDRRTAYPEPIPGPTLEEVAMPRIVPERRPTQRFRLKVVNAVGAGLQTLGFDIGNLDPEELCKEASKRNRLYDSGGNEFLEPLRVFVDAIENAPPMHHFGRLAVRQTLLHALSNRLLLQAYWTKHPEALETPVRRPLFILGSPRTGTTLLFNLLAQDSAHRPLMNWEASTPAPSNRPAYDYKYAAETSGQLHYFLPELRHKHNCGPNDPEECNILFLNSIESEILYFWYDVPHYRTWLNTRDRTGSYCYYRNQLKVLQHQRPGTRWLLKSTTHIFSLSALLTVFPDACIIQTHRDPLKALPSTCSLQSTFRGLCYSVVDQARLAQESAEQLSFGLTNCRIDRLRFPEHHFYDSYYSELVRDPIGTVKAIYRKFDLDLSQNTLDRMTRYLAANPQHKYGVHRYHLEDFGLSAAHERHRFFDYVSAFKIPEES
ncbi:MAG: sulfotransferase [Candidatus Sulfotelmatobacter sp.]